MERVGGIGDGGHLRVHAPMSGLRKTEIAMGVTTIIGVAGAIFLAVAVFKGAHGLDVLQNTPLGYGLFGGAAGITTLLGVTILGLHKVENVRQQLQPAKVENVRQQLQPANDGLDPVDLLPVELSHKIFSYLKGAELSKSCRVSKAWCALASDDSLWKVIYLAAASFGVEDHKEKFGITIKNAPPIPKEYYEILKSPDPVCPEKKMVENWMFLLKIPKIDEEQPFDMEGLGALVTSKKILKKGYHYIYPPIIAADKLKPPIEKPYWVLIRKVVDETRWKSPEVQEKFALDYSEQTKVAHEIPSPRDYAFFEFAAYAKYGKFLYGNTLTYGRSLDIVDGYHAIVGGFSPAGLRLDFPPLGPWARWRRPSAEVLRHLGLGSWPPKCSCFFVL